MFDEETGQPVLKRGSKSEYEPRRAAVPCEASIGCAKGAWWEEPDLNRGQQAVVDLYWSVQATYGATLSEAEREDFWLMDTIGKMRELEKLAERLHDDAIAARKIAGGIG